MDVLKVHPNGRVVASYSRSLVRLSSLLPPPAAYRREQDSAAPDERLRLDLEEERVALAMGNRGPGPLGLSSIPKSVNPRKQRGSGGITPYGRQRVKDAAYLLERDSPKGTMVLWTLTVPPGLEQETLDKWARLTDLTRNALRRELRAGGLSGDMVFVSEYQESREEKYGKPVLHLHFLFRGSRLGRGWILTKGRADAIWARALRAVCGNRADGHSSTASSRVEKVKKSCASYLGKYMSKGCKGIPRRPGEAGHREHPPAWFGVGKDLARRVVLLTRRIRGPVASRAISALLGSASTLLKFNRWVSFPGAGGDPVWLAWYGDLRDPTALAGLFPVIESS